MCCCFLLVALALPYFCLPLLLCLQFSHSVVPNSLQPHGLQHVRLPVHHQLPELAQTHVHQVGDAIQLSHPLSYLACHPCRILQYLVLNILWFYLFFSLSITIVCFFKWLPLSLHHIFTTNLSSSSNSYYTGSAGTFL